jgi:cysteinyl-tRNA synthetase
MVTKHLGFTLDVACGGVDNLVRHHDYTLAVAEGVSGMEFARYWLHGAHLFVDGKKMSKSKGNVYYPADLLAKGYRSEHVRFFLIYGQYRKKLNFTWKKLAETSRRLDAFKGMVQDLEKTESANSSERAKKLAASIVSSFEENMDNDLDVKAAFDTLYKAVTALHKLMKQGKLGAEKAKAAVRGLRRVDSVLQVIF